MRNCKFRHEHLAYCFAIVQLHVGGAALNGALKAIGDFKDQGLIFALGPSCIDFDFLQFRFRQRDF